MRMLRWVQILLGLAAIVAVGIIFGRLGDQAREDGAIQEWSNALVAKEVGASQTPKFLSQTIENGPEDDLWVVSGQISVRNSSGRKTRDDYVAVIRQVCSAQREKKCWVLESLTLGDVETIAVANAAPGGSATVNPVSGGDKPASRDAGRTPEAEVEPFVEKAVRTNDGLKHGDDDVARDAADKPDTHDAPELPTTGDSEVEVPAATAIEVSAFHTGSDVNKITVESNIEAPAATAIEISAINTGSDVNKIVYLIQDRLNRLGYARPALLELDGRFGPRTREAIAVYQRAHGLRIDGRASRELLFHIEGRAMSPAQVAALRGPTQEDGRPSPMQGGFKVQLGAFSSSEAAPKLWRALQARHSDLLGGLEHQVKAVSQDDRGLVHYLFAGPLPSASSANSLCRTLAQRNVNCSAVTP